MPRYAEKTTTSIEKSQAEIERTLERYGASGFMRGWETDNNSAMLMFKFNGRVVRFMLPLPRPDDERYQRTETGRRRKTSDAAANEWKQDCRQRWRALALVIKAKLEAVEAGISTFEKEFMADTIGPNGRTIAETILPQLEEAIRSGRQPQLLLEFQK